MRKFLIIFCMLCFISTVYALDKAACLRYWYSVNVNSVVPEDTRPYWSLINRNDGNGYILEYWNFTNSPPTEAWMITNESTTVEFIKGENANFENWSKPQLVRALKALIVVINRRLPMGNKITKQEVIAEIKDKL